MNDRNKYKVVRLEKGQEPEILDDGSVGIRPDGTLHNLGAFDFELSQEEDDIYFKVIWCTGLKDKTGALIYEGDKLRIFAGGVSERSYVKTVKWLNDVSNKGRWDALDNCVYSSCEIVGNIYENNKQIGK